MTQEELALHSGVTRNVLIDVEHGRRGLLYERLFDIAKALGVPAAKLLKERQEPGFAAILAEPGGGTHAAIMSKSW